MVAGDMLANFVAANFREPRWTMVARISGTGRSPCSVDLVSLRARGRGRSDVGGGARHSRRFKEVDVFRSRPRSGVARSRRQPLLRWRRFGGTGICKRVQAWPLARWWRAVCSWVRRSSWVRRRLRTYVLGLWSECAMEAKSCIPDCWTAYGSSMRWIISAGLIHPLRWTGVCH